MIRHRPSVAATKRHETPEELARQMTGVLLAGLRDALIGRPSRRSARTRLMAMGLVRKDPDHYSALTTRGLAVLQAAQAMETRSAMTAGHGPQDDSAVTK